MAHPTWTLISTHGLVLFHIAINGDATMREIAEALGITERRVAQIIKDLGDADLLTTERMGRRNTYFVNTDAHFRAPPVQSIRIADFLSLVEAPAASVA
jgi:DNA-binding transcriptional regulator GbsR (MarR family)